METHLEITGITSWLCRSLAVPYLFGAIRALDANWSMSLELFDFPRPAVLDSYMLYLSPLVQRDLGRLWRGNLIDLHLHLPNVPLSTVELQHMFIRMRVVNTLTLSGSTLPPLVTRTSHPVPNDGLDFLCGVENLESLTISHLRGLTRIEGLHRYTTLSHLELAHTGVNSWPAGLEILECLEHVEVRQDPPLLFGLQQRLPQPWRLTLPERFHLLEICELAITHQQIAMHPDALKGLHYLWKLDLTGSDLVLPWHPIPAAVAGYKVLRELQHLEDLDLTFHAPFTGGWAAMKQPMYNLGITALTGLTRLVLAQNNIRLAPLELAGLPNLKYADLGQECVLSARLAAAR